MPSRSVGVYDAVVREREADVEVEVLDELLGHQRHQVGVPRQPGVVAGERLGGDRGATDVAEPLEDQDREAGPRQVRGGDEAVVPAAGDHDVVLVR